VIELSHEFMLGMLDAHEQPSLRRSVSLFADCLEIFCGRASRIRFALICVDSLLRNKVRAGAATCRVSSALPSFVERQIMLRTTKCAPRSSQRTAIDAVLLLSIRVTT
jgi:hypothetical protein